MAKPKQEIRKDFEKEFRWKNIEAAHYAQVSEATIRRWTREKKFKKGFDVGPLKVDADTFQKFLRTGRAQG